MLQKFSALFRRSSGDGNPDCVVGPSCSSMSFSLGYFEIKLRDAIVQYVRQRQKEGEVKLHTFNQFFLQLSKVDAGFQCIRKQIEAITGDKNGLVPTADLLKNVEHFGLSEDSSALQHICSSATRHNFQFLDYAGLIMVYMILHLTEPNSIAGLDPDIRLMLSILEDAITNFESAASGRLDQKEVTDSLQEQAGHAKEKSNHGKTANRLGSDLFDSLEWDTNQTISFEKFLRGIVVLIVEEFGNEEDLEELETTGSFLGRSSSSARRSSVTGMLSRLSTDAKPTGETKPE